MSLSAPGKGNPSSAKPKPEQQDGACTGYLVELLGPTSPIITGSDLDLPCVKTSQRQTETINHSSGLLRRDDLHLGATSSSVFNVLHRSSSPQQPDIQAAECLCVI